MEKAFHLYLTTSHTQESHALNICASADLEVIKKSIANLIKSMNFDNWYWYYDGYAEDKAEEFTKPFVGLLEENSEITKKKYPFYHLGFIITNYPMSPDNEGGYEKDFWI